MQRRILMDCAHTHPETVEESEQLLVTYLTVQQLRELLDYNEDTGHFYRKNGEYAGSERPDGYVAVSVDGKVYLAHRLAWFYMYGVWPTKLDHKNQSRHDNSITNLREATHSQNNQNRGPQINNMLGIKGVKRHGNKFVARITHNRIQHYLGLFDTIGEAINARREAANKYFGEFQNESGTET